MNILIYHGHLLLKYSWVETSSALTLPLLDTFTWNEMHVSKELELPMIVQTGIYPPSLPTAISQSSRSAHILKMLSTTTRSPWLSPAYKERRTWLYHGYSHLDISERSKFAVISW